MRLGIACLAAVAAVIAGVWAWLGKPVVIGPSPFGPGEKLQCVSYSPFRGNQTPLGSNIVISPAQIEEDLAQLATITDCIRTYSVEFGQDQIPAIAARHGLKMMLGIWLSGLPDKNRYQVETAIALANKYPDTVRSVVVGNEVLLRGEMSAQDLTNTIRTVKARAKVPVTYADVWEFWLHHRDLVAAVDFVTIHILPYWEDLPIPAGRAAAHVESIQRRMANAFAGKEVIIGEVGWPSAGRMREGALPSRIDQARVIHDVLALAKRNKLRVNVIEAFDEPWKRELEGTVGGHWGLIDDATRKAKFVLGAPVSNHPAWRWQAAGGIAFATLIFAVAMAGRRKDATLRAWLGVSAIALAGGIPIGWAVANVPLESLGVGGWTRSLALCALAVASPLVFGVAVAKGTPMPLLSAVIGPENERSRDRLALAMGSVLIGTLLLAIALALGMVFDPRYRDFPFAPMTAAALPLLVHSLWVPGGKGRRGTAELASAAILLGSVVYIVPNETLANWQSLWLCLTFVALALSLLRGRGAPG